MTLPVPPSPSAAPEPAVEGPLIEPGRRLVPSPGRDRPWRVATVLIGSLVVLLLVLALTAASVATWVSARGFAEIPAVAALGTPDSLEVTSTHGAVRVQPSPDVDEVTLALVAPGAVSLPAPAERVRARLTRGGTAAAPVIEVAQPQRFTGFGLPGLGGPRDLLLLIPSGHDPELAVHSSVGDLFVEGQFSALHLSTDVGDLDLGPVTAPEGLSARAGTGDVDLELGAPAPRTLDVRADVGDISVLLPTGASGRVSIAADVGDVEVTAPGGVRWQVEASSRTGSVELAPDLRAADGSQEATLTITTGHGDVLVTR